MEIPLFLEITLFLEKSWSCPDQWKSDKRQNPKSCTFTKNSIIIIVKKLSNHYLIYTHKLSLNVFTNGQIYEAFWWRFPLISCYKSRSSCNNAFVINWKKDNTAINNKIIKT